MSEMLRDELRSDRGTRCSRAGVPAIHGEDGEIGNLWQVGRYMGGAWAWCQARDKTFCIYNYAADLDAKPDMKRESVWYM
jgi:hypothetical protein